MRALSENMANSRVAKIEERMESWKTTLCSYRIGKGTDNQTRQREFAQAGRRTNLRDLIRCDEMRVQQEIEIDQTAELQQPENKDVVAKHLTAIPSYRSCDLISQSVRVLGRQEP